MEVEEDEEALLAKLFFKKYGRALPEKEKEKENEVDINFVIDLTDETEEMEVAAPVPVVAVVKSKPIEAAEAPEIVTNVKVANVAVDNRRHSSRLECLELAKAQKAITEFGKSLRKTEVIQEKEAPLEAGTSVIADTDSNKSEDTSVNTESVTTNNTIEMAERAIAETDAAIAANQKEFTAEFGDVPFDEFDN
jgi:hypothetical protein